MKDSLLKFLEQKSAARSMGKAVESWVVAIFNLVITASFSYMEFITCEEGQFPFFHLGCLSVGSLVIVSLKRRYDKIYISEAIGAFALFAILLSLFTAPVTEALLNFIQ
ncbi:MAG: hypothetical protein GX147_04500 [Deltaproteobacteria bacterium]|nr:hypothetical protein [Deltaproteobacteria bacterium]